MANIAGFHAVQTFFLFRTSKSDGHFTPEHRSFRWQVYSFLTTHQRPRHRNMCSLCLLFFFFFSFLRWINIIPLQTKQNKQTKKPRKLHSTNETIVWRESLGNLGPVYAPCSTSIEFARPAAVMTQICGVFVEQAVFLTVNHRGPLPLRELHATDETWVWRDPGGSWACLRPVSDHGWIRIARCCDIDMCVASL